MCCLLWCLEAEEENGGDLDRVGLLITDLIMWKDVSKSTLWFAFGSLCFLSTCFTKGLNFRSATTALTFYSRGSLFFSQWKILRCRRACCFSIFSAISQLAILLLAISFFSNSVCQRYFCHCVVFLLSCYARIRFGCIQFNEFALLYVFRDQAEQRGYAKLKEDDILRLAKFILPAFNFAISKTRELFSGEPSMTLKVIPSTSQSSLLATLIVCKISLVKSFFPLVAGSSFPSTWS